MATTVNYERDAFDAGARENYRAFSEGSFLRGVSETAGLLDREIRLCQRLYSYDQMVPGKACVNVIHAGTSLRRMYDSYCAAMYQPDDEEKAEIIRHGRDVVTEIRRAQAKLSRMEHEDETVKTLIHTCSHLSERIHTSVDVMKRDLNESVEPRCLVNHAWEVTRASEEACLLSRMADIMGDMKPSLKGESLELLKDAAACVRKSIKVIGMKSCGPEERAAQIDKISKEVMPKVYGFLGNAKPKSHALRVSMHELLDTAYSFEVFAKAMKDSEMAN